MIRTRPLLGALVTAAVAVFVLAAYGGSSEARGGQDRPWCLRLRLSDGRHRDRLGRGACVGGCAPSRSAGGWSSATSTEPRSNHASAARSTTACNWARTGMDGPTSEPPGLVTGHRLLERPACADCRQVLGALDVAASRVIMNACTKRTRWCPALGRPRDVLCRDAAGPVTTGPNAQRQRHLNVKRVGGAVVLRIMRWGGTTSSRSSMDAPSSRASARTMAAA